MSLKKNIKQIIERAIKTAVGFRFYSIKIKRIQKKIDYLKDRQLYQPFPDRKNQANSL